MSIILCFGGVSGIYTLPPGAGDGVGIAHPDILHMEIIYLSKENSGGEKINYWTPKNSAFFGPNNKHTLLVLTYICLLFWLPDCRVLYDLVIYVTSS